MLSELFDRLDTLFPEMVGIRRDLHMHPELSFQEERTPQRIAAYLESLGLHVRTGVGGRGVVGLLEGGKPGRTIALRADFDALPIHEESEVPYASTVPGVMHACGHDIHTATLLGTARVLSEVREELHGNVVFVHQFAEELMPGGALAMIEDGCLDGVDVIYGAHVLSTLPTSVVGLCSGPAMAASDRFDIAIRGRGTHGAMPHLGVDPVAIASQLVLNLQLIVSRRIDPLKPAVVSVGSLLAGNAFNVIPDSATLSGTVRTLDEEVRGFIEEAVCQIAESTCKSAGATAELSYQRGYPTLWNHPDETERLEGIARRLFDEEQVKIIPPSMGAEDFAYYLQRVPGSFFFVGGGNSKLDATFPHHHPRFNVDERAMGTAGRLFIAVVFEHLGKGVAAGDLEAAAAKAVG
jgi:amidohydrolase